MFLITLITLPIVVFLFLIGVFGSEGTIDHPHGKSIYHK